MPGPSAYDVHTPRPISTVKPQPAADDSRPTGARLTYEKLRRIHGIIVAEMRRRGMKHRTELVVKVGKARETLAEAGLPSKARGIYMVAPHGQWLAEGKQTAMLKARAIPGLDAWCVIVSQRRAWGLARFKGGEELARETAMKKPGHEVSPEEAMQWWPRAKRLWYYRVDEVRRFTEPLKVKQPQDAEVMIRSVALPEGTTLRKEETTMPATGFSFGGPFKFKKVGGLSLDELRQALQRAIGSPPSEAGPEPWVTELYDEHVIVTLGNGRHEKRAYSVDADGKVTVGAGIPVKQVWVEVVQS